MRLSSTPSTNILLALIAMMWPPKSVWSASGEAWIRILRDSMPTLAAFIHVEGDLAEVQESSFLSSVIVLPRDGSNGSPLCLMGIEIRGREDNLVADPPSSGVQDFNRVAACLGGLDSFVQEFVRLPCRFRVPPMSMIPRSLRSFVPPIPLISSSLTLSVRVIVAWRVWGLASVPIFQFPVHHDPLGGQFEVLIIGEAQFAVDRQTAQRHRADIEDNIHVLVNGDSGVLAGTFLSGQVAASDQRFALAVEEVLC